MNKAHPDRRLAALCLLAALALPGCSYHHETNVESGRREQILHFGNGDEPQEIDPHVTTGIPEFHIMQALYEGLVSKDPKTLEIVPGVAASWEISADQLHYTFHLRHDARWSNGDPVTAPDFVYSWHRALMPALGNLYAYMFFCIRNAEPFFKGEVRDFSEVGVRAPDDYTIEVQLDHPTPYFLQLLDHHSYYPVNPRVIAKYGAIDERGTGWTRPGRFVGNGPFTLDDWVLNRILTVKRNPYYWDAKTVRLNGIAFYPIQNVNTEERMFRAGELHITDKIPPEKIAVYRRERPEVLHITPYLGTYFYRFNTTRAPFNDVRVRRALAMSIDRKEIVEHVAKGGQPPAWTVTPPNTNGYTARTRIPYDVKEARRLLAEAGYPDGKGFPKVELTFNTAETHRQIAIAAQQMWKSALNIDITLANVDWQVYLDRESRLDYQMTRAAWIGDYLDPTTFLDMFLSDSGNNRTGYKNPEYDALIEKAAQTADQAERYAVLQQAEAILDRDVPVMPIYTYTQTRLISTDVQGWYHNILDQHPYKYLWLGPAEAAH